MSEAAVTAAPVEAKNAFGFRFVAPLALGSTLNPINSTMISTALAPIAADFHATVAQAGWLIAGLYLASAVAQPTLGRLADLFGPRRVYLVSLCIVAIAGLIGQFSPSLAGLVASRVLLGIGTSGAYPSAMRMFREQADRLGHTAPPRAAMGVLSLAAISTMAIGPLMGGVLTASFGWHSIFSVNAPLALFTACMVILWTPKDAPRAGGLKRLLTEVDLLGIALFAATLLAVMVFLMNLDRPLWWAPPVALGFGTALVIHSLRRRQPFIDMRMLSRNRPLATTYLRTVLVMTVVYSVLYGFAQWLERGVGLSPAQAGLVTIPMSAVAAISSFTGARTKGIRAPFVISIGAALVGCIGLFLLHATTPIWLIAAAAMLFGVPQGMFSTASQAAIYVQSPASEIGTAAGLQRTAGYSGAISATALLGVMYGKHASDAGLHHLALITGIVIAALFVFTLFDRTLPREDIA